VRFFAKLTLDEIKHRGFASRASDNNNARVPAFERNIRKKFKVARSYEIEFFL
jgi:hypothetical protein